MKAIKELWRYIKIAAIGIAACALLPLLPIVIFIWVNRTRYYQRRILQVFDNTSSLNNHEICAAIGKIEGKSFGDIRSLFINFVLSSMVQDGLLDRDLAPLAVKKPRREINPYKDYLYSLTPAGRGRKRKQEEEKERLYTPTPGLLPA